MSIGERTLMAIGSNRTCILGTMDFEDENLIRQAAYLAPTTEQVVRESGRGQRVLDFGFGVGDVAVLAPDQSFPSSSSRARRPGKGIDRSLYSDLQQGDTVIDSWEPQRRPDGHLAQSA
jgi:hypothetical protein